MKTISIDYGKRNIGLAVSDELGIIAAIMPGLQVKSNKEALDALALILASTKAEQFLIGMPAKGDIRKNIRNFANMLKREFGLKVIEWNEDFTSIQAEKATSKKFKQIKSHSEVARTILQEYLDSNDTSNH